MATSGSGVVIHPVAIGVPSPTGRQGHHHHSNSNSHHGGFYQQLTPLTPSATPSPFGPAAQSPFGGGSAAPSPFATSAGAGIGIGRWNSLREVVSSNCLLRVLTLVLSFASALSIAAPQQSRVPGHVARFNFLQLSEFRYCMSVAIIASVYSAVQLFKGICDISFKGTFISDEKSDYISFPLDQVMAYLLMSSSSVSLCFLANRGEALADTFHVAAIVATIFSFAACFCFIVTAVLSGYRLCRRIIW